MKTCIYRIRNLVNNKCYVGSAVDYIRRKNQHWHLLRTNKHFSPHLQSAWNKYGESNFKFEVIELILDVSKLIKREKFWINRHNSASKSFGYNTNENPEFSSTFGKKASKATRDKMSKSKLGKKHKLEHIAHRSKVLRVPILQYSKCGEFIKEWDGAVSAGAFLKIHPTAITKCCRGSKCGNKTAKGFIWKYKEELKQGELLENPIEGQSAA